MRVLLDEQMPKRLSPLFPVPFIVSTVGVEGWAGIKNGALMKLADEKFDAFITADKGIFHQQSLAGLSLRVVVVVGYGTKFESLAPIIPDLTFALSNVLPGSFHVLQHSDT